MSSAANVPVYLERAFERVSNEADRRLLGRFIAQRCRERCDHEWEYDAEESKGPWTGYIERCKLCGALQQVPQ